MSIREAHAGDHAAIASICLLTGDLGGDATGHHSDQTMLADVYATPYLHGPACFALVLDDGDGALGYVLGTSDTAQFQEWFTSTWWPSVAHEHRLVSDADRSLLAAAQNPTRMLSERIGDYPAHLHIDLLPQAQGRGVGRAMIEAACELLGARGARGVHLEASPDNRGALAFYPRVGFHAPDGLEGAGIFVRRLPST